MKWDDEISLECNENNISRLLACLNACKGISTEDLQRGVVAAAREALEQAASLMCDAVCRTGDKDQIIGVLENATYELKLLMEAA